MPTVLFRCDGGPDIGIGHVMRCRSLAAAFRERGWASAFAMSQASAVWFVEDNPIVVPEGRIGAAAVKSIMVETNADCLVVDHYALDEGFERQAAPAGTLTIAIDDLANRPHDCDILIDTNPARIAADYAAHITPRAQLLLGSQYALLRPEFAQLRRAPDDICRFAPRQVLAAVGGADPGNVSARLLEAVPQLSAAGMRTTLIVGHANPRRTDLAERARAVRAEVVCNPPDPVALMANADIAICGAGTTCLEFACLGVPTVALILADNQRAIAGAMHDAGAARVLDGDSLQPAPIAEAVISLAIDAGARRRLSTVAQALIDGNGAARVAAEAARLHAVRKLEQCL